MIYYDLTELYYRSSGNIRFYGIARVVAEIAYEMARLYPETVFVVYDESRQRFFRVKPSFDPTSDTGLLSLGIDRRAIPSALRTLRDNASAPVRAAIRLGNAITRFRNRKILKEWPEQMQPVEIQSGVLFSAARPKVMCRIIRYLGQTKSKVRLSVMLHDLIPLFKGYASKKNARNFRTDNASVIARADQVIGNSRFTMLQLEDFAARSIIPTLPASTPVVALAHECRNAGADDWQPPERPYILGVGITPGRKNLEAMLNAQQIMVKRGWTPPLLILAGSVNPRKLQKLQERFPTFADHVMVIDSPPQTRLVTLYRHAMATVMTSRMEGWGLPAGESMWLGTPAILARTSSLPEVGGDLALYFDPEKPEELAAILRRLDTEAGLLEDLRNKVVQARPSLRSWARVTEELLNALLGESKENNRAA